MFFTDKKRKKNLIFSLLALPLFCGVVFLAQTHTAHAGLINWAGDSIGLVFKGLLLGIFTMFGWMASLAVTIFVWAIDPKDALLLFNSAGVYESWKFVRDFFNLFFILVLLYIAFTVVFQINKDFKKTLLSLVLAALYINFSFPVSRFLIDATNVPMYFFSNQMTVSNAKSGAGVFGAAMSASNIKGILIPGAQDNGSVNLDKTDVSRLLVAIVFIFLFSITLLVLSIMFVIRLVALVILVIFSSVGFAASVIPGMGQYSKMWWDNFWKYAIFGPAAMLMLLIATRFFSALGGENGALMKSMQTVATGTTTAADQTFFSSMALFTIPIIMLWFAMGLAQKMSIAGASSVVGLGQKVSKWVGSAPFRAGWVGAKFLDRKVEGKLAKTKYGKYLAPRVWSEAIKQRAEEQKHKDEQPIKQSAGKVQDQLNDVVSRVTDHWYKPWKIPGALRHHGSDHTDHTLEEAQKLTSTYRKEISDVSSQSDYVIAELKAAIDTKNTAKADAAIQILAKNNDLNDMLVALGDDYKGKLGLTVDATSGETEVSSENMLKLLQGVYADAGESDKELLAKRMLVVSDSATASGNFAFGGMTKFNQTLNGGRGGFEVSNAVDQANWAAAKVKNLESQERQRKLHPDSLFTRTRSGGFGDLNGNVAQEVIKTFTGADVNQIERSRDDLKEAIHQAYMKQSAEFMNMYNTNTIFQQYTDEVIKIKRGLDRKATSHADIVAHHPPGSTYP